MACKGMGGAWVDAVAAFVIACFIFSVNHGFDVAVFDEGLSLYGSSRVASGDVPYRDFWTNYAPGSYYLGAAAFHIFGMSVGILRKVWLVLQGFVAVGSLLLGRRLGDRNSGWLAFALAVSVTIHVSLHSGYTAVPALAGALAALLVPRHGRAVLISGMLTGLTALFRHDFGAYLGVAMLLAVSIRHAVAGRTIAADLFRYFSGMAAIILPTYGALAWTVGVGQLIEQLIVYPATVLGPYYRLPLSWSVGGGWLVVPATTLCIALIGLAVKARSSPADLATDKAVLVMTLSVIAIGFLNYGWIRLDRVHVWPMMIATAPLIAAATTVPTSAMQRFWVSAAVGMVVAMSCALAFLTLVVKARTPVVALSTPRGAGIGIPVTMPAYDELVRAIESRTKPGEPIFSTVTDHERIFANDVLLYFLADRPAPTPYYELNRGLLRIKSVQEAIVRDLDRHAVRLVVLLDAVSDEPNQSSVPSGIDLLDSYIATHYERIGTFGKYVMLERRDRLLGQRR